MRSDEIIEEEQDEETGTPVDPLEIVTFVLGAARRHWIWGLSITLTVASLAITIAVLLPKKYEVRTRILVGNEGIMSRVNPDHFEPKGEEFRGLSDRLMRSDSLRGIVIEAELLKLWTKHRPPLLRFKDWVLRNGIEVLPYEEQLRTMMGTVEGRVFIETDGSSAITIGATWTDPETVTKLVEVAKRRFLDERLQREVEVYSQVASILEGEAREAAREVEHYLKLVDKASWWTPPPAPASESSPSGGSAPGPVASAPVRPAERAEPDPLVVVKLEKVRQQIRELQEPWQRRLTELKLRLTDLRVSYGPKHPLVVHQEARIAEATIVPADLVALRDQEEKLVTEIESFSNIAAPAEGGAPRPARSRRAADSSPALPASPVRIEQSATLSAEQSKLIAAITKYNALSARINSTRLEITSAETAFKYRYVVAAEPEAPTAPMKPKLPLLVMIGGTLFGALLGLAIGPIRELLRGRVLAAWQVKQLGLPVVAEIDLRPRG